MLFITHSLQWLLFALLHQALASPRSKPNIKLLPKPSGPFDVAIKAMELTDTSRFDPYAPTKTLRRIMVSAIYPVEHSHSNCLTPYMPPLTAAIEDSIYHFPNGTYESLYLQTGCSCKPISDAPVIIFSPAQGNTRLDYSFLVSEVASYGFTVIMLDHPYDGDVVEFPDGTIIYAAPFDQNAPLPVIIAAGVIAVGVRVADTSFVLAQLANATVVSTLIPGLKCPLDLDHVAMFGHSVGGATAASAMVNDTRIKGGLDLDGAVFDAGSTLELGTDRPFLLFGHENNTRFYNGTDLDVFSAETWTALWGSLTGWKRELELKGSLHYTFSDFPIQLQTLGVHLNATTLVNLLSGGDSSDVVDAATIAAGLLNTDRSVDIVVIYIVAFFDFVLKEKKEHILDGPSKKFPEVLFI